MVLGCVENEVRPCLSVHVALIRHEVIIITTKRHEMEFSVLEK